MEDALRRVGNSARSLALAALIRNYPAAMPATLDEIVLRFTRFAENECRGYSPLYETLAKAVAADRELLELASHAASTPIPNLLFASVHYLLLGGDDHPLATFYPTVAPLRAGKQTEIPAPRDAAAPFADFCKTRREAILPLLRMRLTQTNEVRRCALLLPAYSLVARKTGLPLAVIEIGCAAGFNLLFDRYDYDYGTARCTSPHGHLTLNCALRGAALEIPPAPPLVAWRIGLDLNPVNVDDADAVRWLKALVWPEHLERMRRLDQAIAAAKEFRPRLVAGDALETLPDALALAPEGAALCVVHSFALNQFTAEMKQRLDNILLTAGDSRLIWRISAEGTVTASVDGPAVQIELTRYAAGNTERSLLAQGHAHGEWLEGLT